MSSVTDLVFTPAILAQHIAIVGKTGRGKTSTGKLIVEHLVREHEGARVCILDPIKSDWWGLISSADGLSPGLPFNILGGPRGHVPLHSGAGAAIGRLVGRGELPLSILDMKLFEPGGQQRFFTDFAPALLQNMTGVLYLVMEEAHEFAPKERAGFGKETMAIHYAKQLATAGRSAGIKLIVATQRVQSLHNAVLGSCETLIAHGLTAPADQGPIRKWLKANVQPAMFEQVAGELSSLPTGHAWVCSGEAEIFEHVAFPRITTYDNSATPTAASVKVNVQTALVDTDQLRAAIGEAVAEAEANDPKALHEKIAHLQKQLTAATFPGEIRPGGRIALTAAGRARAAAPSGKPRGRDLRARVLDQLDGPQQRVLEAAIKAYPNELANPDAARLCGYAHHESKGYTRPRGGLSKKGLLVTGGNVIKAAPILFP